MDKTKQKISFFWAGISFYQGLAGLGLKNRGIFPFYHIVCLEKNPVIPFLRKKGLSVFSLEEKIKRKIPANTGHLLAHPETERFINSQKRGKKVVIGCFKPSPKIEKIACQKNWILAANRVDLNRFFENKISFYQWGRAHHLPLIPGEVRKIREGDFRELKKKWGRRLVIQQGRGWAGKGSFLVADQKEFRNLFKDRQEMMVRITPFLTGKTIIVNGCLFSPKRVLVSPPGEQITGFPSLGKGKLVTCGRQWPARLSLEVKKKIKKISLTVGRLMAQKGFRGFFGLDFLVTPQDEVFLLECNPRLTASFVFFTQLEEKAGLTPLFWYHLGSFLPELNLPERKRKKEKEIVGGELVQRNITEKNLRVKKSIFSGRYDLGGRFLKIAFVPQKESWIVIAPPPGKVIKPGEEIFRLIGERQVMEKEGKLIPAAAKMKEIIKKKIILTDEK